MNKFVENSGSQSKNEFEKNSIIRNSSEVKIAGVEIWDIARGVEVTVKISTVTKFVRYDKHLSQQKSETQHVDQK